MGKLLLALWGSAVLLQSQPAPPIAIRDARIVRVSGPPIARGTVVLRGGLIESVGENVTPPADAWVIDGAGLTVYPGLIDALSGWGLPESGPSTAQGSNAPPATPPAPVIASPARPLDEQVSISASVRAADLVRMTDPRLASARNAGFTSAVVFPRRGIFAGQGAVINVAGETAGQMVIDPSAGLYIGAFNAVGFGGSYPNSMLGWVSHIRQTILDARHARAASEAYARNPVGRTRPRYDHALESVAAAPRVLLPASRPIEFDRMIRFASELAVKPVLYGGHGAFRALDVLKQAGVPVLVSLRWPERSREADPDEVENYRAMELRAEAPSVPAKLAAAGVPFAFYSGTTERPSDLARAVRRAIEAGLKEEQAIRALTLSPAEIFGVADRLGSIDPGKIANLVVTRGGIFDARQQIEYVFIDGRRYTPDPEPAPASNTPSAGEMR